MLDYNSTWHQWIFCYCLSAFIACLLQTCGWSQNQQISRLPPTEQTANLNQFGYEFDYEQFDNYIHFARPAANQANPTLNFAPPQLHVLPPGTLLLAIPPGPVSTPMVVGSGSQLAVHSPPRLEFFRIADLSVSQSGPGLLGKRYISASYRYGKSETPSRREIKGFQVEWNAPIWKDWTHNIGVDLFSKFKKSEHEWHSYYRYNRYRDYVLDTSTIDLGARVYLDRRVFRPFVAFGASYFDNRFDLSSYRPNYTHEQLVPFVHLGAEWQLTSNLATRATLSYLTDQSVEHTRFIAEAILRPHPDSRLFVRAGFETILSNNSDLFTIGLGSEF